MKEELEIAAMKLQTVTEEKDKLKKEVAELVGHQNLLQKIKHVKKLKEDLIEMSEVWPTSNFT